MKDNKDTLEFYDNLSAPPIFVQLILHLALMLLSGFTIATTWGWFVVPLGLPAISIPHAIGLDFLITYMVTTVVPTKTAPFWYRWLFSLIFALSVLFCGYILHLFM